MQLVETYYYSPGDGEGFEVNEYISFAYRNQIYDKDSSSALTLEYWLDTVDLLVQVRDEIFIRCEP